MDWHTNAIYYELYLRAFSDGNGDGHGDFAGLRSRLDYLQWLGVDCIWLLPINPSPLRDDGYDVASYYGIHPTYGVLEDFMVTMEEIHRRGMRLIVDLVMNHTSDQHPWFQESRNSVNSPLRDYYVWTADTDKYNDARIIFVDTERSNWAYSAATGEYYWHRFYSSQPDLNYDNPEVRGKMMEAVKFWMDLGVDGFRLDAVPYLFERENTNCENLPETHQFLKDLRSFVEQNYADRVLLAEANQWPHELLPYFGDGDELQMCFNFPLMPRLFMALARQDRTPVIDVMAMMPDIPENCQWATFLRNHDELTLEMVTSEERQFMWDFYAQDFHQRLNLGIRRRLAPLLDNDLHKIGLMHSLLFALPGAPFLYYGDEIGMGDNVGLPDRNGLRTPMQWEDAIHAGFSNTMSDALYAPVARDPEYGFQKVNVAVQQADEHSLLHLVRNMIMKRKELPFLAKGKLEWMLDTPRETLCFARFDDDHRMVALHNLADEPQEIPFAEWELYTDVYHPERAVTETITLPPHEFRWLLKNADS